MRLWSQAVTASDVLFPVSYQEIIFTCADESMVVNQTHDFMRRRSMRERAPHRLKAERCFWERLDTLKITNRPLQGGLQRKLM